MTFDTMSRCHCDSPTHKVRRFTRAESVLIAAQRSGTQIISCGHSIGLKPHSTMAPEPRQNQSEQHVFTLSKQSGTRYTGPNTV